ncbi:hypothetical protein SAY87_031333 [Trapa incisa]|uniref:Uncharacterized protein n=1 Tax=Trapa incisa TaxID=236973 RepID=A0AAN7KP44_9MYRT|nr:hypothetical protein SAY87_031333 [Trapa incisa]
MERLKPSEITMQWLKEHGNMWMGCLKSSFTCLYMESESVEMPSPLLTLIRKSRSG